MDDKKFIIRAVELANRSRESVGCGTVIVVNNKIIAEEYNSQTIDNVSVNHAEIKAIVTANKKLGKRKLDAATAYCSCEPCAMCLTALSYAKVQRIVFDKTMKDLFPGDPQSNLDSQEFILGLNFIPELDHSPLAPV
ncbi:MAG: deaminase [Candidatus Saccharimonadales bacterium]